MVRGIGRGETWTVLYDADCGFCVWLLSGLLRWDRARRLRPIALQRSEANALLADVQPAERMASWHLISPVGECYSAGAALAQVLRLLPGGRMPAVTLDRFPGLTEKAYRWVAEHRSQLSRLVPTRAKRKASAHERGAIVRCRMVPDPELPLTGSCGCGAVRFEVDAPLVAANYCHCTRCQRRSGTAASANARPERGSFRLVSGEESLRAWRPDGGWEKWFCGECGSAVFSRNPDDPERMSIRMGAFDSDPGIRPSVRQFVAYAAAWEPIPDDGLPRHRESARLD